MPAGSPENALLAAAFRVYQPRLKAFIGRAFPALSDEADDILQDVWEEALLAAAAGQDLGSGWFFQRVRWRALERKRPAERWAFAQLSGGTSSGTVPESSSSDSSPASPAPGPSTELAEAERRHRQGLLLSDVLQEFTRWCEEKPRRLVIKEVYERSIRGQQPAQIAAATGLSPQEVYDYASQARKWVLERLRRSDVDCSVFLTLQRIKPQQP